MFLGPRQAKLCDFFNFFSSEWFKEKPSKIFMHEKLLSYHLDELERIRAKITNKFSISQIQLASLYYISNTLLKNLAIEIF